MDRCLIKKQQFILIYDRSLMVDVICGYRLLRMRFLIRP